MRRDHLSPTLHATSREVLLIALACILASIFALRGSPLVAADISDADPLVWSDLPPLPDDVGFAGAFVGVSGNALVVAGGANFPEGRPWDGHPKVWHDRIFVLERPGGEWRVAEERLPRPTGYGSAVTWRDRMICIGGGDASHNFRDVYAISLSAGRVEIEPLPPLPEPMAMGAAALVGDLLYVVCGQEDPVSPAASNRAWSLDLSVEAKQLAWKRLLPLPGPPRILPVAGSQNGNFFVFSGAELIGDDDGQRGRRFLRDAYSYRPAQGWTRIADLPRVAAAAPSPAFALGSHHLAIIGGDDGALFERAGELRDEHPGFASDVLLYDAVTDTWVTKGKFPAPPLTESPNGDSALDDGAASWPPVTTGATVWRDRFVIASGEIRPGVRTTRVVWARPATRPSGLYVADYCVLAAYFGILLGVGIHFTRKNSQTESYFLGGHKIPWWAAGLSIFGGQLSAITFIALPAKSFSTNWSHMLGNLMILAMAPIVIYFYLPFYRSLRVTSIYEYLERRFNLTIRLLGSVTFILLHLARLGIVLYLPSLALSAVTGLNINLCIGVMGVLTTIYTTMGGVEAVIWTDVIQVAVLLVGALLSIGVMLAAIDGGLPSLLSDASAAGKLSINDLSWEPTATIIWVLLLGRWFEQFVPYTADQTVAQRYLTTSTQKQAARSIWTNAVLALPATLLFFTLGTALWGFYRAHPEQLDPFGKADEVFPWFLAHQLPVGISGLVIAAVFAAAQSTLSTSINSMSAVVTTDFYQRLNRSANERGSMRLARAATLFFGLAGTGFAFWMAAATGATIWDTNLRLVGLIGGPLAGLFAVGVFTRRPGALAAGAGFIVGMSILTTLEARNLVSYLWFAGVGMVSCFATAVVVGWLLPPHGNDLRGLTVYDRGAPDLETTSN